MSGNWFANRPIRAILLRALPLILAAVSAFANAAPQDNPVPRPEADRATAQSREPDPTMKQRVAACIVCHGDQGRAAPDGFYPRIAGKPPGYLYNQLVNFREGRRRYAPMTYLLEHMTDRYLGEIAEYFSRLDPPYRPSAAPRVAAAVIARGQVLVQSGDPARQLPACVDCHGKQMTGAAPNVPGLLGLPQDYINSQLGAWRTDSRRAAAPDCMAAIAKRMSLEDINATASWLASQPVPADHTPVSMAALTAPIECGSLTAPLPEGGDSHFTEPYP
jgi:cytochrome c553